MMLSSEEKLWHNAQELAHMLMPMMGEGEPLRMQHGMSFITVRRFCVNYNRLAAAGHLPPWEASPQPHLLVYYWHMAQASLARAKRNIVYEDELSLKYSTAMAREALRNMSNMAGFTFEEVIREWNWIERLERQFNLDPENLPQQYRFRVI